MIFEQCVEIVLEHEGGYSMDSHDPGGETNFGISKRAYPNLDIKGLKREQAIQIYRMEYWDKTGCEKLPFTIRLLYFDACVNQGAARSKMMLQRSAGIFADGLLGPASFMAIKDTPTKDLIYKFSMMRLEAYQKNPLWPRYGRGWFKRLHDITIRSLVFLI